MPTTAPTPHVGDIVATRYRLERLLAHGGMGRVFAASDAGRKVALKILDPTLGSAEGMARRFRREATLLHTLDHPNIVRYLDGGVDAQGWLFTAMELLEGRTLRQLIERSSLSPKGLVSIIEAMAAGLQAAHEQGIWHGDLKPENVFLTAADNAKIVDFGTSKVEGLERLTRTGEACGTPGYMAPELLTGEHPIGSAIDTYSLGVVVYEAITGRHPFSSKHPGKLLMQIAAGQAPPLETVAPTIPRGFADVVRRAMSVAPSARPRTPLVFARELADALAEEEV